MYNFDAQKAKEATVQWIRDWFDVNGKGCNAVIGISGGKDSSIVAALCVEALGKDRVIGVMMPNGVQHDQNYSKSIINLLGIKSFEINIQSVYDAMINNLKLAGIDISEQTKINLPARIRMSTLYSVSQSNNGRVSCNCNASENYVGYSTRYGDDAGDFAPLYNFTVDEVIKIGRECGLPVHYIEKVPSDGLCGKTDEDNLGFSYEVLDKYIRTGICEDEEIKNLIDRKNKQNQFKLEIVANFDYFESVK